MDFAIIILDVMLEHVAELTVVIGGLYALYLFIKGKFTKKPGK